MQITFNYTKYKDNNPLQKLLIQKFMNQLVSIVKTLNVESILDVGCGEGVVLSKLYSIKKNAYMEGIDYSQEALDVARLLYPYLKLKRGSIYNLPYKDNSFDIVICTEVLEHLESPKEALSELSRVSSKYILLTVPNEPIFRIANFLRGRYLRDFGNTPGHIQHWSVKAFERLLKRYRLKKVTLKTPFPWIMILAEK